MSRLVSLCCGVLIAVPCPPSPLKAEDIAPVGPAIDGFIRPNIERFADTGELMAGDVGSLCEHPSPKALRDARSAFRTAATAALPKRSRSLE